MSGEDNAKEFDSPFKGSRTETMSRKNECELDLDEVEFIIKIKIFTVGAILIFVCLLSCSCAPSVIKTPDLSSALTSNAVIKKNVATAQQDINAVLKDNAIIARPDLTMDLEDANGQLISAQMTIASQSQDLTAKQKQIDTVVAQGNEAISEKNAMEPKHKRDIQALIVAWILCSLACILGPLIFKAYPALVFFPTSLEAVVCSIAVFLICSGVASLMVVFGIL